MSIKAIFPPGVTELTVNGLHQWDYGQQLEIKASDLPAMVEVHFACLGMQAAEVRTCSAVSGTLLAAIPDLCLEQTAPIIAWVYAINGAEGSTVKTITLPIIPRVKPQKEASIPRVTTDAYTQFLTEVNNAVGSLKAGEVVAGRALTADNADRADEASHSNGADTVISKDAKSVAGHLDSLTTAGRYYCDWSAGTPTEGYGYVEVFRRFYNTMQVFYSWSTGDIYIRKTSKPEETDKEWTEWKKGTANSADSANISELAKRLTMDGDYPYGKTITSPGLYLVSLWNNTGNMLLTDWIFITNLEQPTYSVSRNTHYDAGELRGMNSCSIHKVFKLANYTEGGSVG